MNPVDKFGNPIFPGKYRRLQENGNVLLLNGYVESSSKPNLFWKVVPQGRLYADMRGTEEVPIWSDTSPLFYWNFNSTIPMWERRRVLKKELAKLFTDGCPCRLSFYAYQCDEFQGVNVFIDEEQGFFDLDDGMCRFCNVDFRGEGTYCSDKCEAEYEFSLRSPCEVCGDKIEP